MIHKNKYINSSKISEAKFREIVKYFVADLSATQIATLSGVSRNSINKKSVSLGSTIGMIISML